MTESDYQGKTYAEVRDMVEGNVKVRIVAVNGVMWPTPAGGAPRLALGISTDGVHRPLVKAKSFDAFARLVLETKDRGVVTHSWGTCTGASPRL